MSPEELTGMNGRMVLVEAVILDCEPDEDGDLLLAFPADRKDRDQVFVHPSAIREILPAEIGAGDRVKVGDLEATVICIDDHDAWLKFPDGNGTYYLSDLKLIQKAGS